MEPWGKTGVTKDHVEKAKQNAAFRVVILSGKLYVDLYYACVQSRMMFTVWGILQLLSKYPGMVPDVDMMFDCMDKPIINRTEHQSFPPPLFRYCTNEAHLDIPFPDWSFWGWYISYLFSLLLFFFYSNTCLNMCVVVFDKKKVGDKSKAVGRRV